MIRELKKEDAKQVAVLIKQLTLNIVDPLNLEKRIEEMRSGENFKYFVAEVEDKIVGFAGLAWYPLPSKGLMAWVEEVVVDEKARGQGIGKDLVLKLLKLAQELRCNKVELTVTNPIAIKLYESLGFTLTDNQVMVKKY